MIIRTKAAGDIRDFTFDWAAQGELPSGVTITASTWAASSGLTVATGGFTGTLTKARLSGGADGAWYTVTNHITRSDGQTRDFMINIHIADLTFFRIKDPDITRDIVILWSESGLLASGETITASEWTVPTGLTLVSEMFTATQTAARISGGTLNANYTLVNHLTTSTGQELYPKVIIQVRAQ